jgi:hypothetical protein
VLALRHRERGRHDGAARVRLRERMKVIGLVRCAHIAFANAASTAVVMMLVVATQASAVPPSVRT